MSKSERTRQYIIEKTAPVFNMYGFEGTSLALMQEATGLTKGSIYGNFRDKDEIAIETFRYSMEYVRKFFRDRIELKKSAVQKLMTFVTVYADFVFNPPIPGGCPLLNKAVEVDDDHPSMRAVVKEEMEKVIDFVTSLFDEGRKSREFRADIKSRELAYVFFTSIEGAIMVSRATNSDVAMKAVVKQCKNLLESISK
jgi:TetR/AcrR family transcriptional regulator, transcriptional repressor for nem operon